MKPLEWIPKLALGNEIIDSEHKHLFELYNRVLAVGGDLGRQKLIVDLMDYADTHFADEERLMESIGYPELEFHRNLHREFVGRVGFLSNSADWELLDFFQEWLFRHIMAQDFKIKQFMESKK